MIDSRQRNGFSASIAASWWALAPSDEKLVGASCLLRESSRPPDRVCGAGQSDAGS